jgi:hypothetical protein
MSKPFTVTRAEARELKRRAQRVRRTGGVPHARIVAQMREDMGKELRAMVRAYKHPGPRLGELLERMAIARAEGIDVTDLCAKLLEKIAARARPRAA